MQLSFLGIKPRAVVTSRPFLKPNELKSLPFAIPEHALGMVLGWFESILFISGSQHPGPQNSAITVHL